jgi:hypothetical protein
VIVGELLERLSPCGLGRSIGVDLSTQVVLERRDARVLNGGGVHPRLVRVERQLLAAALGERQADEAPPVGGHEVDVLGRDALGGDAEIALVLAILVVHEDDHATGADLVECFLDGDDRAALAALRHRCGS